MPPPPERRPSRQGLVEYLVVLAFAAIAAAGAIAIFGDEVRAAFGGRPAAEAAPRAPAR